MECEGCRTGLPPGARFCPECGAPVADATPADLPPRDDTVAIEPMPATAGVPDDPQKRQELALAELSRANLARIRRSWEAAIDHAVSAMSLAPGFAPAHAMLGDIYRDQGRVEESVHSYRLALDSDPGNAAYAERLRVQADLQSRAAAVAPRAQPHLPVTTPSGEVGEYASRGTTPLMGASPRSWLVGIAIATVVMLVVLLASIVAARPGRHAGGRRFLDAAPDPVAPALLRERAVPDPGPPEPGPAAYAGAGLSPDVRVPVRPFGPETAAPKTGVKPPRLVAPAAITGIRPMLSGPVRVEAPAPASASIALGAGESVGSGMQIVQTDPREGTTTLMALVSAPIDRQAAPTDTLRLTLMRGAVLAAKKLLSKNGQFDRAAVYVSAGGGKAAEDLKLHFETSRAAAEAAQPDKESLAQLTARAEMLEWGWEATPAAPAPASGSLPGFAQ